MSELKALWIPTRSGNSLHCYLKYEADKFIAEKDAEIEELKSEISRKNAVGQRWFERCMEARVENVKLKRALWLARALRARDKAFEYHFKNNVEMCAKWDNVHLMLMAKAEEYK
jgi:hypothetical protein